MIAEPKFRETKVRFCALLTVLLLNSSGWASDSFHESLLADLRAKGASRPFLIATKERFAQRERGVVINDWNSWTNSYKPTILNPPVVFDLREPFPAVALNFGEPVSACRSYLRALFVGDEKTLLNHADETGADWLKNFLLLEKKTNYWALNKNLARVTRITVLMTATAKIDGNEYALLLWRAEHDEDPTHNVVALQCTFFLSQNKGYLLTRDVHESPFGSVLAYANASGAALAKHEKFKAIMEQSSFPTNFYKIR